MDRTPQEAFQAITDVRGWWSQEVEGVTDQVGGEFDYHYRTSTAAGSASPNSCGPEKVAWRVLENYFDFIDDQAEWKDTRGRLRDLEKEGRRRDPLHPRRTGSRSTSVYDVCTNAWGGYIGAACGT
ncbi:hypothetical protein [Nonomuraea dietziae]|uniref:hypothetical protein n=1 Tax=Nonomuraea dietziae TaxID=65515 RepID=UPI0031E2225B